MAVGLQVSLGWAVSRLIRPLGVVGNTNTHTHIAGALQKRIASDKRKGIRLSDMHAYRQTDN
eukprot:73602-Rhodomonas_salina.1